MDKMKNGIARVRNTISSKQVDKNNTTLANGKKLVKEIEEKKKVIFQSNPSKNAQNINVGKKVKFSIPVPTPNIQVSSEKNNSKDKQVLIKDTEAQKMLKELEISDPTQLDFQLPVGMKSQVKNEIQNKKNILIKLENYYINNSLQHIEKFEKYNLENFKLTAKKILYFDEEDLSLEEINQFHNEYKDLKDKIPKEMQTSIDFNIHLIINLKNSIKKSQIN